MPAVLTPRRRNTLNNFPKRPARYKGGSLFSSADGIVFTSDERNCFTPHQCDSTRIAADVLCKCTWRSNALRALMKSASFAISTAEPKQSESANQSRVFLPGLSDLDDLLGDNIGQRIGAIFQAELHQRLFIGDTHSIDVVGLKRRIL